MPEGMYRWCEYKLYFHKIYQISRVIIYLLRIYCKTKHKNMTNTKTIAIVGGGASGTAAAIYFLQQFKSATRIVLIEKNKETLYRGAAYSSKLEYEPLNVPAGKMSLFNNQPDDFYNWILKNKTTEGEITRDSFVSRRWFGDYTEETLKKAVAGKQEGVTFEVLNAYVTDMHKNSDAGYTLDLDSEEKLHADVVILATGNEAPADVISAEAKETLGTFYIANPWQPEVLAAVGADDEVLIVGTGLTMIDYVVSLKKRNHRGKITAVSLNGLLPKQHKPTAAYAITRKVADENIHRVFEKLKAEFAEAAAGNTGWRSVLDALRTDTTALWKGLSEESKKIFMTEYRPLWEIHRHRMPKASADELAESIDAGNLEIVAGRITATGKQAGKFTVYYETPVGEKKTLTPNFIINCTGPLGDYAKSGNVLFKNLLAKKWITKDTHNLGIVTGSEGELVRPDGEILENVFAIGPLRKASEWETTAMREVRTQAQQLAEKIIATTNAEVLA
jgi:uncharacterized NAD(P)/FAD-binding protein YdhS